LLDLALLVIKNNLAIQFLKSTQFKVFVTNLSPRIIFPSRRIRSVVQFVGDNKTKICYVKTCKMLFVTTSFDLWMSKGTHHILLWH
jgi:hypothetical protein